VGGDLECRFCWVVGVPVFLYEFQGVVEILDRFPGVVSSLIVFPVDQEFVRVVLAAVVKYVRCFPFSALSIRMGAGLSILRDLYLSGSFSLYALKEAMWK